MHRPVLQHSTADSRLAVQLWGSKISQLSTVLFQLTKQREAPELCQKFTGTWTHPDTAAPSWAGHCCCSRHCCHCSLYGQIPGKTYCTPQARALRGKNVKFCNSRHCHYHTKRTGISPVQAQGWGGGGGVAQRCLLGCGRTAVTGWHVPHHHLPQQGHQAAPWQGFRGKKALSEVYQAITLLLFRALNNKYLQKSNGSSAPRLTSEAELSLVLFPVVGELGRCTWQVLTSHLCQGAHFHYTSFSPSFFYLWWYVPWLKATWAALVTSLN